jgi:hypothetical protein
MSTPKQKVKIKIKVNSTIVVGYIQIAIGGKVSDYIASNANKFLTVKEAMAYPTKNGDKGDMNIKGSYDAIYLNMESIEMMTVEGIEEIVNEYA